MQLKEFSLVSQGIESGEVLKAIETAIPAGTIEQVLAQTDSWQTPSSETAIILGGLFGNSDEYMVIGFDANCLEKSGQRVKNSVAKVRTVLAEILPPDYHSARS